MHVILWRFRARPGSEAAFEATYGDDGDWSSLFRIGEGYLGTVLLQATDGMYLTIDRWTSKAAYTTFGAAHAAEYAGIDNRYAGLAAEEALLCALNV